MSAVGAPAFVQSRQSAWSHSSVTSSSSSGIASPASTMHPRASSSTIAASVGIVRARRHSAWARRAFGSAVNASVNSSAMAAKRGSRTMNSGMRRSSACIVATGSGAG